MAVTVVPPHLCRNRLLVLMPISVVLESNRMRGVESTICNETVTLVKYSIQVYQDYFSTTATEHGVEKPVLNTPAA